MNTERLDTYWEYFDKFYCISIDERADRRADAKVQFEKVGLADKVEFVIVQKHPYNCEGIGQAEFISKDPLGFKDLVMARLVHLVPTQSARIYKGQLIF